MSIRFAGREQNPFRSQEARIGIWIFGPSRLEAFLECVQGLIKSGTVF
jgi:hypothetical protein